MTLAQIDWNQPAVSPAIADNNHWIQLMAPAAQLAAEIANTDFVPAEFRNKPAAIAACILFGAELGIGPMMSLCKVDIVKGRPAPRAELGRALALAAGHELWVEESTNTRVTVAGKRRGSQHVHTCTWTMDDARKAGIAGNQNYTKYPRQMLFARASAELVRQMAPEVLGGILMFAEEAADADDVDIPPAPPTNGQTAAPAAGRQTRRRTPKPAPEPSEQPALPDDPTDIDGITPDQVTKLIVTMKEIGLEERDDRLNACAALIGHTITSSKELTKTEASTVIDGLESIRDGSLAFHIDNEGNWHTTAVSNNELDQPELPGDDFG